MGVTAEQRRIKRAEQEAVTAPRITRDAKGWRVDLPTGDYAYQPSEQFAVRFAQQWNDNDQRDG